MSTLFTRTWLDRYNRAGAKALILLLWQSHAVAQDALRSALSSDTILAQKQQPTPMSTPDQPHLGPVNFTYGVYGATEYLDNINGSEFDPEADILLRGGLNLGFIWPATERSLLQFGAGIGYVHYEEHPQYSGLEVSPNSALMWQIGLKEGTLSLYDQLSYVQQVSQEASIANLVTVPRLDNTIGLRANWEPEHWLIEGGYAHNLFLSPDSAYQYLNRSSEYFFARAGWRFAERTQVGLETSAALTAYDLAVQSDNWNFSAGPYAEWQVTQHLRATVRGGPTLYHFTSAGAGGARPDLNSYYAGVNLSHELTQFLSHQINLQRDISYGLNLGSDYVEQFTANYSITFGLTSHIRLAGSLAYEQGRQPLLVQVPDFPGLLVSETEDFSRAGFGASFSWDLTEHFNASVRYNFWKRQSSLFGQSYVQNIVSLQLNYNF